MAKARRRRRDTSDELPGWVWMLFGLAIGLTPAVLIYVNAQPGGLPEPSAQAVRAVTDAVDDNDETTSSPPEEEPAPRFDFYNMLPSFEVVIPEQEPDVSADTQPQAVIEPGLYVLQAGSFSKYADADRRRAELALQGIESRIQRVSIDDTTYHRVRIGPVDDLDQLNLLRARLREAHIDVLRIRLAD